MAYRNKEGAHVHTTDPGWRHSLAVPFPRGKRQDMLSKPLRRGDTCHCSPVSLAKGSDLITPGQGCIISPLECRVNNPAQSYYLLRGLMWLFFFVPLSCLAAPDPEVVATNRPLNLSFLLVPEAWMICCLHFPPQPLELLFPRPLPSLNVSQGLKMLLILLIMQRTLRSEAWPDLIHILETLLCLSEKVTRDRDRESVTYFLLSAPFHLQNMTFLFWLRWAWK